MPSKEILRYFDATVDRETRDDLRLAVNLVKGRKVAIDCGCGAGSDIAFLRSQGFIVHAFDIEEESISRCAKKFEGDSEVLLSQSSFSAYTYPEASLIVADASLFFCPKQEFSMVWRNIENALNPSGVFCGSFLGSNDTMAGPNYDNKAYWPDVLVMSEQEVKQLFMIFKIESFTEHRSSGKAPYGELHQWHIFSVVAKKESNKALQPIAETGGCVITLATQNY